MMYDWALFQNLLLERLDQMQYMSEEKEVILIEEECRLHLNMLLRFDIKHH
jgi:hypothetical protein